MKREVNRPAATITAIIMGILVCVLFITGMISRKNAEKKSNEYQHATAIIMEYEEHEHEDSDGDEYYTYSATIRYEAGTEILTQSTKDIFRYEPEIGESIDVMYHPKNSNEYYVAEKDWLTGKFFPSDFSGDGLLFSGVLCLSFFVILVGFLIPGDKAGAVCISFGLILIGLSGIVFAFILKKFSLILMSFFGIIGVIILYIVLTRSKEQLDRDAKASEYIRLFIVREIIYDELGKPVVIFAKKENVYDEEYYSYVDYHGKFQVGDKYQLDTQLITDYTNTKSFRGIMATDISYISQEHFLPLSALAQAIFKTVN